MNEIKSYAASTNQGPLVSINEDAVHTCLHNNLFLLFDGFGGVNIGDIAVSNLIKNIDRFYTKVGGDPDSTFPFFYSHRYLLEGNALINAMYLANENLVKDNGDKGLSQRGGASMVGAVFSDNIATICSTGNCLSYLYRNGELMIVCLPDTLVPISCSRNDGLSSTNPLSAFGLFHDLQISIKEVQIEQNDILIMLTDGAYSFINDDELLFVIDKNIMELQKMIEEVFNIVNERGNVDNQSIIALRF